MNLDDLRPCDRCRGPLVFPPSNWFWRVRVSGVLVSPPAAARALADELQRHAPGGPPLSESLVRVAPDLEVLPVADRAPGLGVELLVCSRCYDSSELRVLVNRRRESGPR